GEPAGGGTGGRDPGGAPGEPLRAVVRVRVRPAGRADELEGRAGDPAGGGESEGVGRQPDGGGNAGAGCADVGGGDVPAAGPLGGGLRQPVATRVRQPVPTATHPPDGPLIKFLVGLFEDLI